MGIIEDGARRKMLKDHLTGVNYKIVKSSSTRSETNIYPGACVMTKDRGVEVTAS
jgi:hypothetical protein